MIKQHLLIASENEISEYIKTSVREWQEPATSLQILKTLDLAVHTSGASGFVVKVLEIMLNNAIVDESTTYENIVKLATWRNE